MGKSWRDYASTPHAISANSANSLTSPPNGINGTNGMALPSLIVEGMAALREKAVPSSCNPERWSTARHDAERLISEGWATLALRLGWSALDLFGAAWGKGEPEADGLAVWLEGRDLRALSDDFAVVVSEDGGRFYFNRPREPGAWLLWEMGGPGAKVVPLRR